MREELSVRIALFYIFAAQKMNELNEMKIAINSFVYRIAEIANYDKQKFAVNLCVVVNDEVIVVNCGEKKVTVTKEEQLLLSSNSEQDKLLSERYKALPASEEYESFILFFESCCGNSKLFSGTKENYFSTLKYLKDFTPSAKFCDIDYKFVVDFEQYLYRYKLHINTVAKHMKQLKRIVNTAIDMERMDAAQYPFRKYHIKTVSSERQHLNYNELDQLEAYLATADNDREKEVLTAFLFGCYTGLRYSDLRTLHATDIQTINRQRWIIKNMKKTKTQVRLPLMSLFNAKPLHIIRKLRRTRGLIFRLEENYKSNTILRRIIKKCGIKKNITFHCGRHTAATMLLFDGVNITTVQHLLGHHSVKQTEVYSAVTDNTIINELKKVKSKKRR